MIDCIGQLWYLFYLLSSMNIYPRLSEAVVAMETYTSLHTYTARWSKCKFLEISSLAVTTIVATSFSPHTYMDYFLMGYYHK